MLNRNQCTCGMDAKTDVTVCVMCLCVYVDVCVLCIHFVGKFGCVCSCIGIDMHMIYCVLQ